MKRTVRRAKARKGRPRAIQGELFRSKGTPVGKARGEGLYYKTGTVLISGRKQRVNVGRELARIFAEFGKMGLNVEALKNSLKEKKQASGGWGISFGGFFREVLENRRIMGKLKKPTELQVEAVRRGMDEIVFWVNERVRVEAMREKMQKRTGRKAVEEERVQPKSELRKEAVEKIIETRERAVERPPSLKEFAEDKRRLITYGKIKEIIGGIIRNGYSQNLHERAEQIAAEEMAGRIYSKPRALSFESRNEEQAQRHQFNMLVATKENELKRKKNP